MSDRRDPRRLERASIAVDTAERIRPLAYDPAVVAYFDRREDELKEAASAAVLDNPDSARRFAMELQALREFRAFLAGVIRAGAHNATKLEELHS